MQVNGETSDAALPLSADSGSAPSQSQASGAGSVAAPDPGTGRPFLQEAQSRMKAMSEARRANEVAAIQGSLAVPTIDRTVLHTHSRLLDEIATLARDPQPAIPVADVQPAEHANSFSRVLEAMMKAVTPGAGTAVAGHPSLAPNANPAVATLRGMAPRFPAAAYTNATDMTGKLSPRAW